MPFLANQKVRSSVYQAVFVGGLALLLIGAVLNARTSLAEQGTTLTTDFLWKSTGWEMTFSLLPTHASDPYWWYLLMGLLNTVFLGIVGLALATAVGGLVGIARISDNKAARLVGTLYVETFRNIPLIVQLFFWYAITNRLPKPREAIEVGGAMISNRGIYLPGLNVAGWSVALFWLIGFVALAGTLYYSRARRFSRIRRKIRARNTLIFLGCSASVAAIVLTLGHKAGTEWITLPELKGLNIRGGYRIQPEVYALAFSIAIYGGAYIGEIVRGGFKAVGKGQSEAAMALGLSPWQAFSRVRLPLAMRAMLPILANQYVWLIKATTLGIVVGFSDFFMVIATSITQSGQTLEFIALLMSGFLVVNLSLAWIFNRINAAVKLRGHQLRS